MANNKQKSRWKGFWVFALLLALAFLILIAVVMGKFSDYLQDMDNKNVARENARSELAVDAYMAKIDGEYVAERLEDLYAQADGWLQSGQEFRSLVESELTEGIGCKLSFSSADKRTYVLYNKRAEEDGRHRQIGEFTIEPNGVPSYGYAPWGVTGESFDMSYLLTPGIEVMVPENYTVWVNGKVLTADYQVQTGIGYPVLDPVKSLTPALKLPAKVVYRTGYSLGPVSVEIRDPQENPVTIDENTDWNQFLRNCTEKQEADIQDFAEEFMRHYVRFNSTRVNCDENCRKLVTYMVPKGQLADRMWKMVDGLHWTDDKEDKFQSIEFNHIVALSDGRFICDITYTVYVIASIDSAEETTHCQLVLVPVDGELKVESMVNYLVK